MRGTVKQGGPGNTGTLKEENTKTGGRRTKANNNNLGGGIGGNLPPGGSVSMVIKQENVEVKPDPDATASATSPILNGEDSLKTNLVDTKTNNKNETKVRVIFCFTSLYILRSNYQIDFLGRPYLTLDIFL